MATFTITGIKEIDRALAELELKVSKKLIKQAMRKSLKPIAQATKRNAPIGETGELRKGIKVRAGKRVRNGFSISVRIGDGGDFAGDLYYAAMAEYGTSKQPAQGFMRRAFDANKAKAKQDVTTEIAAGIERIAGGK